LGLDGHAAFLAAFAFDADDRGAVVGGADVADIGLAEFLARKPPSSAVRINARSRSAQSAWRFDAR
jgi:hypothetical protein